MSNDPNGTAEVSPDIDYEAFQARPEFQAYKHKLRRFVFPLAAAFMIWFLLFVILGAYAREFMSQPLWGVNVGLWLGLAQFVTTFGITSWYVAYANKNLDPDTVALRAQLEDLENAAGSHNAPGTEGGAR